MNSQKNKVIADIFRQHIKELDEAKCFVVNASGNDTRFTKTFSDSLPQDFNIAKKHLKNMFEELENVWRPTEPELSEAKKKTHYV